MILVARMSPTGRPGPRCPRCGDWTLTRYGAPGSPIVCPCCGLWRHLVVTIDGVCIGRRPTAITRKRGRG